MIKVVVADDQEVVRMGFRMVLQAEDDLMVVGEVADGAAAIQAAVDLSPDVVLMDIRMPFVDGIAATRAIVARCPAVRVLVITTFDLDEYVMGALRAGASGFLLKDVTPTALIDAIHTVVRGEALVASAVTKSLIDYAMRHREDTVGDVDPKVLDSLSRREMEVLTLVARGLSNGQVAAALCLGETTIKSHVSRLLTKLHLRSRVQAVVLAYEAGLVQPGGVSYEELLGEA